MFVPQMHPVCCVFLHTDVPGLAVLAVLTCLTHFSAQYAYSDAGEHPFSTAAQPWQRGDDAQKFDPDAQLRAAAPQSSQAGQA